MTSVIVKFAITIEDNPAVETDAVYIYYIVY